MNIDHINIAAPHRLLESVRDFYCAVLGLEDGFRPQLPNRGFWLYSGDKPLLHLSEKDVAENGAAGGYLDHVAFRSSGLQAMIERLKANGVSYRSSYLPEFDMTQLFFKDPAGTGLEVNFLNES